MGETVKTKYTVAVETLKKIIESPSVSKIRSFILSDKYTVFLFVLATLTVITGTEVFGTMLFALIITFTMAVCDDYLPVFEGILFVICFAIRCKHSFDSFIKLWWMAPPIVIFFLLHFIINGIRLKSGKCTKGIVATSLAVTFGGIGSISAKEYFSSTSIFYIILLGFGMLLIYLYFSSQLKIRNPKDFADRFAKMMTVIILFLCVCLAEEYISRYAEFFKNPGVLPFQWRNNGSTILMLAMPFPFYFSVKKFGYFFIGILAYGAILCTGSRGGMLFGLIELMICILAMTIIDKRNRRKIIAIMSVGVIALAISLPFIADMLSYTLARFVTFSENEIRIGLIKRGIEDFISNPLFGKGIGYMGNSDIHHNAQFTLCWYHCSPIQVIGSFGILGIIAYGYLLYERIKLYVKNISFFNTIVFISYIGLELMSFVNPGIFSPFPYLFLVTVYFVIIEHFGGEHRKKELSNIMQGITSEVEQ